MALYEYICDEHGPFEVLRPMSESEKDADCPICGHNCRKTPAGFTWNWGKAGHWNQSHLEAIERRHRGNVSDEVKERHSGVRPRKRRGPLSK